MFLVNTGSEETYSQVKYTYHITDCLLAAIYQKKISRINYSSQCLEFRHCFEIHVCRVNVNGKLRLNCFFQKWLKIS